MKSSKLPVQAEPVMRINLTISADRYTLSNGIAPSIVAPIECLRLQGDNTPLCQMWRSGQIMF